MKIAIIGGKESGKTTFLVILYASQIRYSELTSGEFRFYINPNSLKAIGEEYNRMHAGTWPSEVLKSRPEEISFLVADGQDDAVGQGRKKMGFLTFFKRKKETAPISLDFSIFDLSEKDIYNILSTSTASFINLPKKAVSLLSSNILVFMIDTSKLTEELTMIENKENLFKSQTSDNSFQNVIINISRYNRSQIYPIIIFTKTDLLNEPIMRKLGLSVGLPPIIDTESRRIFSETILKRFYPGLLNQLLNNKRIEYRNTAYFFSHITTIKGPTGKRIPKLIKGRELKYLLDCSYQEHFEFIMHLKHISRIKDN